MSAHASGDPVESDARIVEAGEAVDAASRELSAQATKATRIDRFLPAIDESKSRCEAEHATLQSQLPFVCAGVLLGEQPPSAEAEMLERIADLERTIRRCILARPVVEARARAIRLEIAPFAAALQDARDRLDAARREVRGELEWEARR